METDNLQKMIEADPLQSVIRIICAKTAFCNLLIFITI
jgi:hypothetical protein